MYGGEVLLHDKLVRYLYRRQRFDGIVYVTEDRKLEGFFETKSVVANIYLGFLAKMRGKRKLVSNREAAQLGKRLLTG